MTTIIGDQAGQISRVLRMKPGNHLVVLDNTGYEYEVELSRVNNHIVIGNILNKQLSINEPRFSWTLFASPLKRENFEWLLQKCTEIGISRFIPTISSRSVINKQEWSQKIIRWNKIIQEASEQSTRGRLPILDPPLNFYDALKLAQTHNLACIPWEGEKNFTLHQFLSSNSGQLTSGNGAIMIGPEGGFSEDEISSAKTYGIHSVSLGKRILRSETAAIFASAWCMGYDDA